MNAIAQPGAQAPAIPRARFYRVVLQQGAAAMEVTLSDAQEAQLTAMLRDGRSLQVWQQRPQGGVESLTLVPSQGSVRHVSQPVVAGIPVNAQGVPVGPNEQPAGVVSPVQHPDHYAKYVPPTHIEPFSNMYDDFGDVLDRLRIAVDRLARPAEPPISPKTQG